MRLNSRTTLPLFVFSSLLLTLIIYWFGYDKPTYGIDDANIYFVYMRNFATGHGFVWNLGGERVEGFTSLLWTLTGAALYKFSGEHFAWWLLLINFILTYSALYRLLLMIRRCNNTVDELLTASDVIIMALLLFPLGFLEWSILSLMETGLWLFLIVNLTIELCSVYILGKKPDILLFSVMLSIMILTRPESMLFGFLFICLLFMQTAFARGIKQAIGKTIIPLAAYIATLVGVILWRISYFGYPFPNTYYAKVSGSEIDNITRGLSYLHTLFYGFPEVAFSVGIGIVFAVILLYKWIKEKSKWQPSANDKVQMVILAVVFTGLAIPVITGGDHFKMSRFYQSTIPLTYAGALNFTFWKTHIGQFTIGKRSVRALLTAAICFGVFFIAKSTWFDFTPSEKISAVRILPEFYHARTGRNIAEKENTTFAPLNKYPSVGILAAGGFGYIYNGNTVDLMGLNNTMMAHATRIKHGFRNHASFDVKTFWKLEPDMVGTFYGGEVVTDTASFILPENTDYFRNGLFVYFAYKQLFDYPQFIDTYLPALIRNTKTDYYIFAYYNKAFLKTLDNANFQVILLERKLKPKPIL